MAELNLHTDLLPGVTAAEASTLETALREFITTRELNLYRIMSFQMGWHDQNGDPVQMPPPSRLHGQLTLSVASALWGGTQNAAHYAVSIELLYNFSLIHEDVEDGNSERNGRPSVWWTWGPAQAINAGDGMHAMARLAVFALTDRGEPFTRVSAALRILDEAAMDMIEGEYLDITFQDQPLLSREKYLQMTESRSGALFGCAALLGALSGSQDTLEKVPELLAYGRAAGAARQLARDYNLFWGDGRQDAVQHGRLLAKKKNLPVAHAFETGSPNIKRRLGELYLQRVIDPSKVDDIKQILEEAGAREHTMAAVESALEHATAAVEKMGLTDEGAATLIAAAAALGGAADSA